MKLTMATKSELIELAKSLEHGKQIDFCNECEPDDNGEYLEENGESWFCIGFTSFRDSNMLCIGGYSNPVMCVDDDEYGYMDLPKMIDNYWQSGEFGDSVYYCIVDGD